MRSLKQIAQDLRAMSEMLAMGATELEQASTVDGSAFRALADLFGGGGTAQPNPTRSVEAVPSVVKTSRAKSQKLPQETKDAIRREYQYCLNNKGMNKEQAVADMINHFREATPMQIKAILFNNTNLATARSRVVRKIA